MHFPNIFQMKCRPKSGEKLNVGSRWVWVPMNPPPPPQSKFRGDAPVMHGFVIQRHESADKFFLSVHVSQPKIPQAGNRLSRVKAACRTTTICVPYVISYRSSFSTPIVSINAKIRWAGLCLRTNGMKGMHHMLKTCWLS